MVQKSAATVAIVPDTHAAFLAADHPAVAVLARMQLARSFASLKWGWSLPWSAR
jgi:hypothetical protein